MARQLLPSALPHSRTTRFYASLPHKPAPKTPIALCALLVAPIQALSGLVKSCDGYVMMNWLERATAGRIRSHAVFQKQNGHPKIGSDCFFLIVYECKEGLGSLGVARYLSDLYLVVRSTCGFTHIKVTLCVHMLVYIYLFLRLRVCDCPYNISQYIGAGFPAELQSLGLHFRFLTTPGR